MYKSPIDIMVSDVQMKMEDEILKAVQSYGVVVNKEELIKALKYDRNQYDEGYQQGYDEGYEAGKKYAVDAIANYINSGVFVDV